MTAGHCFAKGQTITGGIGYDGNATWATVGTVSKTDFTDWTSDDAGFISPNPGGMSSGYSFDKFAGGSVQADGITTYAGSPKVGDSVCMGGVTTDVVNCGSITTLHYTVFYSSSNVHVQDTTIVNFAAQEGDSGAFWGYTGTAYGIESGFNAAQNISFFTPIPDALKALGATLLTASGTTPSSWSYLKSRFSGKCLDVSGNQTANGTKIDSWTCNGTSAQWWSYVPVGSTGSNILYHFVRFSQPSKCASVDLSGGGFNQGAQVWEWDCLDTSHHEQEWYFQPWNTAAPLQDFNAVNLNSGQCLDLDTSQGGTQDGAKIQQWNCWGGQNQRWYLA